MDKKQIAVLVGIGAAIASIPLLLKQKVGAVFGAGRIIRKIKTNYGNLIKKYSDIYGVPQSIITAVIMQESRGNPFAYRYEPYYDVLYISCGRKRITQYPYKKYDVDRYPGNWRNKSWFYKRYGMIRHPIRIYDFYQLFHRKYSGMFNSRQVQRMKDCNKSAQLRVSASYGLMQLMYPTTVRLGYSNSPEGLYNVGLNIKYGTKHLRGRYDVYKNWDKAIRSYNAGSHIQGQPAIAYATSVNRYRELYYKV